MEIWQKSCSEFIAAYDWDHRTWIARICSAATSIFHHYTPSLQAQVLALSHWNFAPLSRPSIYNEEKLQTLPTCELRGRHPLPRLSCEPISLWCHGRSLTVAREIWAVDLWCEKQYRVAVVICFYWCLTGGPQPFWFAHIANTSFHLLSVMDLPLLVRAIMCLRNNYWFLLTLKIIPLKSGSKKNRREEQLLRFTLPKGNLKLVACKVFWLLEWIWWEIDLRMCVCEH